MPEFVFLTTLTPSRFMTPLRARLQDLWRSALQSQTFDDWEIFVVGERSSRDRHFVEIETDAVTKTDRLLVGWTAIQNLETPPRYVIRLDDDDLVSPTFLERASRVEADCFADQFHWYYDLVARQFMRKKQAWIANTCAHAFEHAAEPWGDSGLPLLLQDHSATWHHYYSERALVWAAEKEPIYVRTLSPNTLSAGYTTRSSLAERTAVFGHNRRMKKGFSDRGVAPSEFEIFEADLQKAWSDRTQRRLTGRRRRRSPKNSSSR